MHALNMYNGDLSTLRGEPLATYFTSSFPQVLNSKTKIRGISEQYRHIYFKKNKEIFEKYKQSIFN